MAPHNTALAAERRRWLTRAAASTFLMWTPAVKAAMEVEGVTLDDTILAHGKKLVLNGVGVRKRSYYKADVTALYLPDRSSSVEQIMKLDGLRRIQLNMLREFSSSTISRIFIGDFKQVATDDEFKSLIEVVGRIGATYASVKRVVKGDVVNLDWVPGKGWLAFHNGRLLLAEGYSDGVHAAIHNELAYQVYLRMYIGPQAPADFRTALLGLKKPAD